jgi:hypothetical protein
VSAGYQGKICLPLLDILEQRSLDIERRCQYRTGFWTINNPMPKFAKIQHEKFAQSVASGLTGSAEAYLQASGRNRRNFDVCANVCTKQAAVKQHIEGLRAEQNGESFDA